MDSIIRDMIEDHSLNAGIQDKRIVHEVLQQIVLAGLYRSGFFEKAAFYGGTCLRLFHGLDRFSEDLDFSLLEPNADFDLSACFDAVIDEFAAHGCEAEIRKKKKTQRTPIESAFLKSDTSIYSLEAEAQGKITIKIEVDTNPPGGFATEALALVTPFTFLTPCYVLPDLYAGKMSALMYRQWKNRVKGRDWYDFSWYVRKGVRLNLDHFNERVAQTPQGELVRFTQESFLAALREKIDTTDIDAARNEVRPFLRDGNVLDDWSREYFQIQCEHIRFL
ncbi:MAG: nucleotidyl transferase AbiEii/AbiGii toxin family protein [Coriobacteriales bacterium]|jgi:predicted nucleotidyltransferase component of viral defense system|nr:nucleotidyl transferase AbiEii/AbiGii toxin family protein [Coriobacteriales bacterium]